MKVCTDACVFGAWIADEFSNNKLQIASCFDIGTGTGLLSLMFAQKNAEVLIDTIEIEKNAYEQAKENFSISKWNDRLKIFHSDIKDLSPGRKYDLIISNPPFYENELQSDQKNKNLAKHDEGLTLKDLIIIIKAHLAQTGLFAILLPYHRMKYFEDLAGSNNLFPLKKLLIRQTPSHNFFRGIVLFGNSKTDVQTGEMTIKNDAGCYTEAFTELLKDYYLNL